MGHHRFEGVELARQPRGQTVRQQAEGGVAFATVPASDVRPARGLARIGAVACQRTVPVRVIRAAIEPCIAPRLGPNVLLAGKPRLIAKLHRPRPGGVPPARANSSLVPGGVETTTTAFATPSEPVLAGVRLDVDASPSQAEGRLFGPSAVLRTVWTSPGEAGASPPLAHTRRSRAHILTASATTIHENGDGTDSNRFPDCSVIPGNPSTEQTGELPWGFHETKRDCVPRDRPARVCKDELPHFDRSHFVGTGSSCFTSRETRGSAGESGKGSP